jgi:hypothetical protein
MGLNGFKSEMIHKSLQRFANHANSSEEPGLVPA